MRNRRTTWGRRLWSVLLTALTAATFCVQGFHPLAEDGGLYAAGVEYRLDPTLFPHYTEFVQAHLRYSVFAPVAAGLVHATHLPFAWVLLLLDLASIGLTLLAGREILRRVTENERAQLAGVALLAAWWTLPVAGTSLMLMDPYVTARSFSMPLSLLAIGYALDEWAEPWVRARELWLAALCLLLAAAMHPLMAGYAVAFVAALRCARVEPAARRARWWVALTCVVLVAAAVLQRFAPAESAALRAAAITRYYWFLSQWQWYELLGIVAPVCIFALLLRVRGMGANGVALCRTCVALGVIAAVVAVAFAREGLSTYLVARMQPLRMYVLLYAMMALLLGMLLEQACRRWRFPVAAVVVAAMAAVMGVVQWQTFPQSRHVEMPWSAAQSPNPWVQAFLWAKETTPRDALFALDAKYVNTDGEDAQTFRAISLRSAMPDYSKDGGEAAITPTLAVEWKAASAAQKGLSQMDDAERDAKLRPFGATWMVLHADAATAHPCPYRNDTVKVCRLTP